MFSFAVKNEWPEGHYVVEGYHYYKNKKCRIGREAISLQSAVFMHTLYLGRWYYDGYRTFMSRSEAEDYAKRWLGGRTR